MTKFSKKDFLGIYKLQDIDADLRHWSKNITDFTGWSSFWITLRRKVSREDIDTLDLDVMPGFELTWHYTKHVENNPKYTDENKDFIRYTKEVLNV